MRVEDARGTPHEFSRSPARIVSLVPSITETLFCVGAGDAVVGVTDYCVHPARELETRARVGGTKNPSLDAITRLSPDLVIANREENRRRDVERLEAQGIEVFVTYARSVREALDEIACLAAIVDRPGPGQRLAADVEFRWEAVRARIADPRPRVAALVWKAPYMAVGSDTFAHDMLEQSGGANVFAEVQGRYPRILEPDLVRARPEVILLPTEPFAFGPRDRDSLLELDLPAAQTGRIHVVEGELLSWYGPRMGRALELFASLFAAV